MNPRFYSFPKGRGKRKKRKGKEEKEEKEEKGKENINNDLCKLF